MLDCAAYPISRLVGLLGPAVSVMAEVNTLIPNRVVGDGKKVRSDVDDNVTIILQFAGGQHAVIGSLWGMAFKQNNTIIYGRKGTIAINDSGYPLIVQTAEPCQMRNKSIGAGRRIAISRAGRLPSRPTKV